MAKKTNKEVIPLFEDNIKDKIKKNDNTINKRNTKLNTDISNNKINNKSRKTVNKVRKVDDDNAKISTKSKSKRSKDIKESKINRTKSKKSDVADITTSKNTEKLTVKVGRKTAKNNWWNGCDYVWVDGIDHWVSKTAFRNDGNNKPIYSLNNYVQGLDSYWCLRYKPNNYISESDKMLTVANNELKKKCKNWKEISIINNLKESFIIKYKNYIEWHILLENAEKNNRTFSEDFKNKFNNKFMIMNLTK